MSLLELFCDVDDFWLDFEPQWKASHLAAGKQRERAGQLCPARGDDDFDPFSSVPLSNIQSILHGTCPGASDQGISSRESGYPRFVALIPTMMLPLLAYAARPAMECVPGSVSSTRRRCRVCDPKRISQHRVFAVDAKRGKSSMGWFFGFQLHLAVNDQGEILACCLTPGNVDDRQPVPSMVKKLRGKLFGDRGYISAPLTTLLAGTRTRISSLDCVKT